MLDEVTKSVGKTVVVHDSIAHDETGVRYDRSGDNAYYDPNTDTYHIALDSVGNAYAFVAVHESIHEMRAKNEKGYKEVMNTVITLLEAAYETDGMTAEDAKSKVDELIKYQADLNGFYTEKDGKRTYSVRDIELATEEVIANTVPVILTDEEQSQRFAKKVMDGPQTVREWFKNLIMELRKLLYKACDALKGQKSWEQMEILRNQKLYIDMIAETYFEGMEGTRGKSLTATTKAHGTATENANADGMKYSLKQLKDGTEYVKLDGNIFTNADGSVMSPRQAYNSLIGTEIRIKDGDTVTFIGRLPGAKDMYNELFRRRSRFSGNVNISEVNDKINRNIIETLVNSNAESVNVEDRDGKHKDNGIYAFDTRTVNVADENNAYTLKLSIARLTDGRKIAYAKKSVNANPDLFTKINQEEALSESRWPQPDNKRVSQSTSTVNTSIRENVKNDSAISSWTSARIDSLLKYYGASRPTYSKAYATRMSPDEYLSLTATDKYRDTLEQQAKPLDEAELRDESQPIYLSVDMKTGEVTGHEGRHRMIALRNAGVESVPVVILHEGTADKTNLTPVSSVSVTGQEFRSGKAPGNVTLNDLVPISGAYIDEVRSKFGQENAKAKFSTRDDFYAARAELQDKQRQCNSLFKSEEYYDLLDEFAESSKEGKTTVAAKIAEWEARNNISTLNNEISGLKQRIKDIEAQINIEEIAKYNEAVASSGLSLADYHRKEAVKEFGYTPYFVDAGYIIPNGKMLNFSGEKGKHYGTRGQDHRAISTVFAAYDSSSGSSAMVEFINEGNIRMMPESPGLDIGYKSEPTTEQKATIRRFIRQYAGSEYFNVDFTDIRGNTVGSYEYDYAPTAQRVIADIEYFFEKGETRIRENDVSAFRFSSKDAPTVTAAQTKAALKENEQLKKALELAKQELTLTSGHQVRQSDIEKLAKSLIKEHKSSYDRDTLVNDLHTMYDYIANADTPVWDEVRDYGVNMARAVHPRACGAD